MKYSIVIVISFFVFFTVEAQESINTTLKQKLDSILYKDQTLRELFDNNVSVERKNVILNEFGYTEEDFKERFWSLVGIQDSLNLKDVEEIILTHGYPGKTLVGEPTNEAVWYVIQHSDKIEQYFPLIEKAGNGDELPKKLVAMMQDRLLMNQGKEQIYGTQVAGRKISISTDDEWFYFVWPIKDPKNVNKRRKELGFSTTIEENAKSMDVEYQVYTLKQIDSIVNQK